MIDPNQRSLNSGMSSNDSFIAGYKAPTKKGNVYGQGESPLAASPLAVQAGNNLAAAGNVYADQLSGKAYSPLAVGIQEGQARAEAQRRAAAAQGINQAGLSGTPLGAGAGYGVEVDLMRNRFDDAINLNAARQADMRAGAAAAGGHADDVNRFEAGLKAGQSAAADSAVRFVASTFNDNRILNQALSQTEDQNAQMSVWNDYLDKNPEFVRQFSAIFGGEFTTNDVMEYYYNHKSYNEWNYTVDSLMGQGYEREEAEAEANRLIRAKNAEVTVPKR